MFSPVYLLNIITIPINKAPIAVITTMLTQFGIVEAALVMVFTAAVALGSADTVAFALTCARIRKTTTKVTTNPAIPIPTRPTLI